MTASDITGFHFTYATAKEKVRAAENSWNTRQPTTVAESYTADCQWRNRDQFISGRDEIINFLENKWAKERDYRLIKELWAFNENRIAVRFAYEWQDEHNQWYRSYGNENWQFDQQGKMIHRFASINDILISEQQRLFHWPLGPRPIEHLGLSELGL